VPGPAGTETAGARREACASQ